MAAHPQIASCQYQMRQRVHSWYIALPSLGPILPAQRCLRVIRQNISVADGGPFFSVALDPLGRLLLLALFFTGGLVGV